MADESTYRGVAKNAARYGAMWGTLFLWLAIGNALVIQRESLAAQPWLAIVAGAYGIGALFGATYLLELLPVWRERNDTALTAALPLPNTIKTWVDENRAEKSVEDITWNDAIHEAVGVFIGAVGLLAGVKIIGSAVTGGPVLAGLSYPAILTIGIILMAVNSIKFVVIGARRLADQQS
jgi:hypothetical protein